MSDTWSNKGIQFRGLLDTDNAARRGNCWVEPESGGHNDIKTHEYHTLQPITSPIIYAEGNSQDSQEEDDTLKGIKQQGKRFSHYPSKDDQ